MAQRVSAPVTDMTKKDQTKTAALAEMDEALGIDCYRAPFPELLEKLAALHSADRLKLLRLCERAFATPAFRAHEATRVATAKIVIGLLPESTPALERWLRKTRPPSWYRLCPPFG